MRAATLRSVRLAVTGQVIEAPGMPYCQRVNQPEDHLWPVAVVLPFCRHLRELPC